MAGVEDNLEKFLNAQKITIVACGTSWHAGLVAEYVFEDLARIPLKLNMLPIRYRNPVISNKRYCCCYFSIWRNSRHPRSHKIGKRKRRICFWNL